MLEAVELGYRAGERWLVRDVSFRVRPGEFWAVVGANGAGKSTLMRLLSGERAPHAGHMTFFGQAMSTYSAKALARRRACLLQERGTVFPFTVYEVALMGRMPWQSAWMHGPDDEIITRQAMDAAGVEHFADRLYPTLSGGEKTRVDLARAIAQNPKLLLLDEPTNHLDARHQLELLGWCREHATAGGAVVTVLHDLNLAASHADRMLLLDAGRVVECGTPDEVLTLENLRRYFNLECVIWRHPAGCPWVVPVSAGKHHAADAAHVPAMAACKGELTHDGSEASRACR